MGGGSEVVVVADVEEDVEGGAVAAPAGAEQKLLEGPIIQRYTYKTIPFGGRKSCIISGTVGFNYSKISGM